MSEEHFDGILKADERSPNGYKEIDGVNAVLINQDLGKIVITGKPNSGHNCDLRGCGSIEHKIAEFDIDRDLFDTFGNYE